MSDGVVRGWRGIALVTTTLGLLGLVAGIPGVVVVTAPLAVVAWMVVLVIVPREHEPTRMRRWLDGVSADDFADAARPQRPFDAH